ncbi:hypothetical protein GIB67_034038 [Kingdonia uniflora]|uniref:Scarecrow-like protein 9 n=1 Tax=Kingdonia uniflora TaxID=39325 RepID=A0A7J7M624_9MAGN|nr:hypothetical protein GIB67_034038 [Kingdonia uniflora]
MDQRLRGLGSLQIDNSTNPYQNIMKMFPSLNHSFNDPPRVVVSTSVDSPEDCDFNDTVLKYISQMLMEEDMEEKSCMVQESLALQAAEKPFYEALGKNYPPLPDQHPFDSYPSPDQHPLDPYLIDTSSAHSLYQDHDSESPVDNFAVNFSNYNSSSSTSSSGNGNGIDGNWGFDYGGYKPPVPVFPSISQSTLSSPSISDYINDGPIGDSPDTTSQVHDIYGDSDSAWHFRRGVEEASKFLPSGNNLIIDLENNRFLPREPKEESHFSRGGVDEASKFLPNGNNPMLDLVIDLETNRFIPRESQKSYFRRGVEEATKFLPNGSNLRFDGSCPGEPKEEVLVKEEKKDETDHSPGGSRGKKNLHREDVEIEEGRSNKHSAVFVEETVRTEMFDMVLLCHGEKGERDLTNLRETWQAETSKNSVQQSGNSKLTNGGKSRGKKQSGKREVVDLRTLLIQCAQSVAADDRRSATDLLKQIRQHASPFGDGNQRLAHCFADGLEARLAGTGSKFYMALLMKKTTAADILKAYHLYLAACPFKKISNFFSNQTIMKVADKKPRLHIIDFGIMWGFQWPCLIQKLSGRSGGPPNLRITGIELPQPGFRPAERVEETGRRLANYAESFKVPFEFNAIAQNWETIQLEDFKIDPDEILVVNCLYRFRNLLDETVVLDSPRNAVLNLIKKLNPSIFIHGIVNGAFSAPFFITRFRETLFHYSALFDMLEANVPREHPERLLIEQDLFGPEAMNVIACEGTERVERPETYKQWQVRNLRAGFVQCPLNQEIIKKARDWVRSSYHKDFVFDEDSQWMLQGWKGRIIYALSVWRPVYYS